MARVEQLLSRYQTLTPYGKKAEARVLSKHMCSIYCCPVYFFPVFWQDIFFDMYLVIPAYKKEKNVGGHSIAHKARRSTQQTCIQSLHPI